MRVMPRVCIIKAYGYRISIRTAYTTCSGTFMDPLYPAIQSKSYLLLHTINNDHLRIMRGRWDTLQQRLISTDYSEVAITAVT